MKEGTVMDGAEPLSVPGGPDGALVIHGFTGTPHSMRGLAVALAATGLAVEAPLLPGHGTSIDDMVSTGWADWSAAADAAYQELAARCRRVVVAGLSMGGALACELAAGHPEVAGLVLVNPFIDPPAESFRELMTALLESGTASIPGIGGDVADSGAREVGYPETPVRPLLSLCEGLESLLPRLGDISCPVLLLTSRRDHVVPTISSEVLAERVSGPVERAWLERSYHVATLDHDGAEIERRAAAFASKVLMR